MVKYIILLMVAFGLVHCADTKIKVAQNSTSLFATRNGYLQSQTERHARFYVKLSSLPEQWILMDKVLDNISKDHKYSAIVLDNPSINAFALPGNKFYITTGLLDMLDNENQLAGVIAHELSHIDLHHVDKMISDYSYFHLGNWLNSFSRENEYQADENIIIKLKGTPYNPEGLIEAFRKMQSLQNIANPYGFHVAATHPETSDRISTLETKILKSNGTLKSEIFHSSEEFLAMKKRMSDARYEYLARGYRPEEPPRFISGDTAFDKFYKRIYEDLRVNVDLSNLRSQILQWLSRSNVTLKQKGALYSTLSTIDRALGRTSDLIQDANLALANWPELSTPKWDLVFVELSNHGKSDGENAWRKYFTSSECQNDIDCIKSGSEFAFNYFFTRDFTLQAIEILKKRIKNDNSKEMQAARKSFSYLGVREIYEDLFNSDEDIKYFSKDESTPSLFLQDWIDYQAILLRNNNNNNYKTSREGWYADFGFAYGYDSDPAVNSNYALNIGMGYRWDQWAFGFRGISNVINPSTPAAAIAAPTDPRIETEMLQLAYYYGRSKKNYIAVNYGVSALYSGLSNTLQLLSSGQSEALEFGRLWYGPNYYSIGSRGKVGLQIQQIQLPPFWGSGGASTIFQAYVEIRFTTYHQYNVSGPSGQIWSSPIPYF